MLVLGLTGWVRRVMGLIPMPIVMGMVAGVFLRFGTDLVHALGSDVAVAAPMVVVFLLLSTWAALGRWLPPIIGALVVGAIAVAVSGRFTPAPDDRALARRARCCRSRSGRPQAMIELVVPLAITVLVVQNGQGIAVLRSRRPRRARQRDHRRLRDLVAARRGRRRGVHLPDRTDERPARRVR